MTALRRLIDRLEGLTPATWIAALAASLLALYAGIAVALWQHFGSPWKLAAPLETFRTPIPQPGRPPLTDVANWALFSIGHSLYGPLAFHIAAAVFSFAVCAVSLARLTRSNRAVALFYLFFSTHILFHFEVFTLRDTIPFAAFLAGFVYATTLPRSSYRAAGMGMFAGLGWMTRATGVLFIPLIVIVALSRGGSLVRRVQEAALALAIFAVVSSPWQAAIVMRDGRPSISSFPGNGIYNAVKGNNELTARVYPWLDLDELDQELEPFLDREYAGFSARSIIQYVERRPVEFLALQVTKTLIFFAPFYTPPYMGEVVENDEGLQIRKQRLQTHNPVLWPLYVPNAAALAGFVAFLFRRDKDNILDAAIWWLFVLFLGMHYLIWMETRFRLPIDPILFVGSALFFHRVGRRDSPPPMPRT